MSLYDYAVLLEYEKKKADFVLVKETHTNVGTRNQTLQTAFAKRDLSSYPKGSKRFEELTDYLAMYIATSTATLMGVEKPAFKKFVKGLN